MKKLLLNYFLVIGLVLTSVSAWAQVPVLSYPGSPFSLPVSTAATIPAPSNTGGVINAANAGYNVAASYATVTAYASAITTDNTGISYYLQRSGGVPVAAISKLSGTTTTTLTLSGVTLNSPTGIALDGAGNLFVSDSGNGVVYEFTLNAAKTIATLVATIGTPGAKVVGGIDNPIGIAFDSSNNIYIADQQDGGAATGVVFKVAAGSTTVTTFITGLNTPYGIALDGSGNTYVSQNAANNILKINGGTKTTVAGSYSGPRFLTANAAGDIYIADYGNLAIKEVSAAGIASTLITSTQPNQVSFDPSRNMYIADQNTGNIWQSLPNALFTITPTLPAGLTFNASTGAITGTTSATVSPATTYTVTGYNSSGKSTTTIVISINKTIGVPTISYATTSYTYTQGTTIPAFAPPTTTNTPTSFSISPSLPTGLTFSTTTGVISGTPTVSSPTTTYTVAATNANGSGYTTITITVNAIAPVLTYAASYTYATNATVNITPTASGGTTTSATVTPALPSGVTLNANGTITGASTVASTGTYKVTPSNAAGAGTSAPAAGFTLTFAVAPAFSYLTPYIGVVGTAFSLSPIVTAGSPTSYAYSGATLPAWLSFSTTTGTFSGIPSATTINRTYTVTATNAAGLTNTFNVTIKTQTAVPFSYTGPNSYVVGTAITSLSPSATISSATITPNVVTNTGLTFSTAGVFSGTPTAVSAATTYSVTGYSSTYTGYYTATVSIATTAPAAPTISYTPSSYNFTVGSPNSTSAATNTGGTATYSVDATTPLPAYLTINSSTGVISGNPPAAAAAAVYKVNATNYTATVSANVTITCVTSTPPVVSYTPASYTFVAGTGGSTSAINNTGGAATYSFDPATPAPSYLTINSTTGVITCAASAVTTAAVIYTIDATNASATATTPITITINPAAPVITYTPAAYTFTVGVTGSTSAPGNTGGAVASYAMDPTTPLPAYLSLNTSTGVITSSTASVSAAATAYKVIATNATSTSTATVTITELAVPNLAYSTPNTYTVGTAIPTLSPTNTGGAVTAGVSFKTPGTSVLTGLSGAYGVTTDVNGNVYVTNFTGNTVTEYTTGGTVVPFGSSPNLSGPVGIVVDASGNNEYVLNKTANNVVKYTNGVYQGIVITGLFAPTGIALDAAGNIYVANSGTNGAGNYTISKYPSGGGTATLTFNTNSTSYPVSGGIAVDGSGNIFVVDNFGGSYVDKYTAAGVYTTEYTVGSTNAGLYIDGSNNIYLTTTGTSKTVLVYTPNFAALTQTINPPFTTPDGVATDKFGNMYVSDFGANTVTKYVPVSGYYLSGALPTGLAFNNTNGNITGTPTAAFSGSFTVTAYNAAGAGTSNTFTITCGSKPVLSYPSPDNYAVSATNITPLSPTNTGSPVTSIYTVSPALPAGLTINSATGVISGPPNAAAASATYTVSASNSYGTGTFGVVISIVAPPALAYTTPNNYLVGTAIPTLSPTNTGGTVSPGVLFKTPGTSVLTGLSGAYGVTTDVNGNVYVTNFTGNTVTEYTTGGTVVPFGSSPNLSGPVGIVVDASGNNEYVLNKTANNVVKYTNGVYQGIVITGLFAPTGIALDAAGNIYVANSGTNGAGNYTISKYPSGGGTATLTFNTNSTSYPVSGGIAVDGSGNIFVVDNFGGSYVDKYTAAGVYTTEYTVGSTNAGLYIDGSNNIYLTTTGTSKTVLVYTPNFAALTQTINPPFTTPDGVATDKFGNMYVSDFGANTVTKYVPVSGYYLSGALPTGLAFNNTNGNITGTPTAAFSGSFTVTAYNAGGPGTSNTFVINCNAAPTVVYTPATYSYATNTAITAITPTVTGTPTSFTISAGFSATGLNFDTTTGIISGTTAATASSGSYTVKAINAFGNGTTTVTFNIAVPPTITYNTPNTYLVGTAISPVLAPTSANVGAFGFGAAVPFSPTPPAGNGPTGMGFDAAGNVYVANYNTGTITKYSAAGAYIGVFATGEYDATGIVFDTAGNAYISILDGYIDKYSSSGAYQSTIVNSLLSAYSISIDASNNLYVADGSAGSVYKYSTTGTLLRTISGGMPSNAVADGNGNIYVLDFANKNVTEYSVNGPLIATLVTGLSKPYALNVDQSGNIYIGDTGTNSVRVYSPSGAVLTTITGTSDPEGVLTDARGNLYVSNYTTGAINLYPKIGGYYIASGVLPAGLVFDSQTGNISGTPTAIGTATLTVNAYGPTSLTVTSNSFVITCNSVPIFTYPSPDQYVVGATVSLTPTNTGSTPITNYSASSLPPGLSINNSTGVISGTTTTIIAATDYTVTATNAYGTGTYNVNIEVGLPPAISYPGTPYSEPVNATITPITPVNTGFAVATSPVFGPAAVLPSTGLSKPYGMAVDASGNIYVVNYTAGTVLKYTNGTGTPTTFISGVTNPTGIAFDSNGYPYVLNTNGFVYRYALAGGTAPTATTITGNGGGAGRPGTGYGIKIDASNNIFVADELAGAIYKYTASSNTVTRLFYYNNPTSNRPYIYDITGVQVDAAGNIYTMDYTRNVISKWSSTGTYISSIVPAGTLVNPYGFYMDAAGNFFVADAGKMYSFSPTGALLTTIGLATGDARGIVTDQTGNLYVSDYTANTVTRYPSYYGYTISPTTLPAGLTFNNITGTVTGTPAAADAGNTYDYTVIAYNNYGVSNTTPLEIKCYTGFDWIGTTSSDWNTTTNWISKVVPVTSSDVKIGVNVAFANQPTVSVLGDAANTIAFGNKGGKAPILTVNSTYTLAVTGDITKQSDASSNPGYTATLAGAGTITVNNINVQATTTLTGLPYTETLASSIAALKITGNVNLTSNMVGSDAFNAAFNVTGGTTSLPGTFVSTNTAGSTSTISVAGGTLKMSNATPLSSLSSTGTNVVNFNGVGGVVEYSGANQTIYTDAVLPNVSNTISYTGLTLSGIGAKTPNAGNLNIGGSFTNSLTNDASNYVTLTGTPVFFNGTVAQTLAGGAGTGTIFNNVSFSGASTKTMTSGSFSVISSGLLTMSGSSTSTILNAGGFLTLISDVNGSATVPAFTGPSITGNVTVQRYITGGAGYRGYRLVSSPVYISNAGGNNVISVGYPILNVYLKGTTGSAGGFDDGGNPNLYLFRENLVPSNTSFTSGNFRGVNNISTPGSYNFDGETGAFNIPVGNGFMMFYRGSRKADIKANEYVTTYVPQADTLNATGILNQGPITVKDWFTPSSGNLSFTGISGDPTINGFNLVGNPYASSIDWDNYSTSAGSPITAPGVGPFLYVLDSKSSNYNVYQAGSASKAGTIAPTGSNIIPSGQGFFVVAGSTSAAITFNEAAKTNAQATAAIGNLFMGTPPVANTGQYMRLMLAKDSIHVDGIVINFNSTAKPGYVFGEDAPYKLGNGPVSLASTSADNIGLAINTLPLPTGTQVIKLQVGAATDGVYTLALKEVASVPAIYDVWLKDAYRKDSLDIKHNPTYAFDVLKSDTASFGANRFSLIIRQNPLLGLHLLSFAGEKITTGTQVVWTTENEQNYTNFTVERSIDNGTSFQVVGGFASTGAGTYSFIDKAPVTTVNDQYRLKLVDLNGNITYSSIVIIQYAPSSNNIARNGMTIYPNPAIGTINVSINQTIPNPSYQIQVVNNLGTVVKTATSTNTAWQDDVSRLVPGTYIIKVINNANKTEVGKGTFVKL